MLDYLETSKGAQMNDVDDLLAETEELLNDRKTDPCIQITDHHFLPGDGVSFAADLFANLGVGFRLYPKGSAHGIVIEEVSPGYRVSFSDYSGDGRIELWFHRNQLMADLEPADLFGEKCEIALSEILFWKRMEEQLPEEPFLLLPIRRTA
jgi:hypothetical protein